MRAWSVPLRGEGFPELREGQGRRAKKRSLNAGKSAFLLSQTSFLFKARRSTPNKAGTNPEHAAARLHRAGEKGGKSENASSSAAPNRSGVLPSFLWKRPRGIP